MCNLDHLVEKAVVLSVLKYMKSFTEINFYAKNMKIQIKCGYGDNK